MVRSVTGTLEAAQSAATRDPYIKLYFTSYDGLTNIDLSTDSAYGNRILLIDHHEEAYNDYATIILRNYSRTLSGLDLTGYWVEIGYGDVTGGGNEYAYTPRLWVKAQQEISIAGKLLVILELEGMWAKLRETLMLLGNPPLYIATFNTSDEYEVGTGTIYDIVEYIIENEIDPIMILNALVEDDSIIDSLEPTFYIGSTQPFEDAAHIIHVLMNMTLSYMKPLPSLSWEIKYPQDSDAIDLSYYSNQAPEFIEYMERTSLALPNRIVVVANRDKNGKWDNPMIKFAQDDDSVDRYGTVIEVVLAPEIDNETDAQNRANVIMQKVKYEASNFNSTVLAGRLIIAHDCRMELYDKVAVYDARV